MNPIASSTLPALSEGNPYSVKVLMYHRIVDDESLCRDHWTCIHVQDFRRQLEFLDRWGFTAITIDDFRLFQKNRLNLPRKPVIISFDDGYLDTYQYAFPLLREFGMKAIVFVLGDRSVTSNDWDKEVPGILETPLMDRDQILDMHASGFEIGAHTMTHPNLTMIPTDEALYEIEASKDSLEDLLDVPVRSFSYPYGYLNETVKEIVRQVGFEIAYSVSSGPAMFSKDIYETRRTTIYGKTGLTNFAMKMMVPYQRYEWARWKTARAVKSITGKSSPSCQDKSLQPPQPLSD